MLFSYVEIKITEVWLDLAMVTCHNIWVSVRTCFFLQTKSKKNQPTTWISCEKALSHLPIYAKLCNRVAIDPAGWSWFRQDIPFFFRARISIRSQTFVKKTEPDLVSLLNFDNSRSFRCNFVCKTIVNFRLHRLWQESEQESDSQNWKISGYGFGFKSFGRRAESGSEKVTLATCAA